MNDPTSKNEPEPTPFEKMRQFAIRVMAVPKAEIDRREKEWREGRRKSNPPVKSTPK